MEQITVIVPAYNAEKTIGKCLDSLLETINRAGRVFKVKIIVIDDGSRDSTLDILNEYATNNPDILVFHQENKGIGAAREVGLRLADGDYLAWCDSDDWVEPDWLLSMYQVLIKYDADIVRFRAISENRVHGSPESLYTGEINIWNREEAIYEFLIHKKINGILWASLFRKSLFDGLHFNENLLYYEDADMTWQVLQRVNKVVRVDDAKYHWVISEDSLSNGKTSIGRIRCIYPFWGNIAESVRSNSEWHGIALEHHIVANFGCLKRMYIEGISNKEIEHDIRRTIINNLGVLMGMQPSVIWKLQVLLVVFCGPIARVASKFV